jgi:hypothetical protein
MSMIGGPTTADCYQSRHDDCTATEGCTCSCHGELQIERELQPVPTPDPVNHPDHYTSHPSGVEVIEITRWMTFNKGNAVKYILRAGLKPGSYETEDLEKAIWYLKDEILRLRGLDSK